MLRATESIWRDAEGSLERTAEMGSIAESPFQRNFGDRPVLPNVSQCNSALRKTARSNPSSNGYTTLAEKQMQISNRNAVCPGNRRGRQIRIIESFFDQYPNALE